MHKKLILLISFVLVLSLAPGVANAHALSHRPGPDGTIWVTTRFATSLDPDWTGPADIVGGNLLKIVWDPVSQKGLTTLLIKSEREVIFLIIF